MLEMSSKSEEKKTLAKSKVEDIVVAHPTQKQDVEPTKNVLVQQHAVRLPNDSQHWQLDMDGGGWAGRSSIMLDGLQITYENVV